MAAPRPLVSVLYHYSSYKFNIMEQNDRILCHDLLIRIELGRLSLSTFFRYYIHTDISPDLILFKLIVFTVFLYMSRMSLLAWFLCVCFYFCVIFIFFCFVCPDYSLLSLSKVGKGGGGEAGWGKLLIKSP